MALSGSVHDFPPARPASGPSALAFVPNRGQTDPHVRYTARSSGLTLFLAQDEAVFVLWRRRAAHASAVVRLRFPGQNPAVRLQAADPRPARVNVFCGRDPSAWRTGLPTFGEVWYRDLWPGIDLVFRGGGEVPLKSEFHLAPGARVSDIRLVYAGAEALALDEAGNLLVPTRLGSLVEPRPYTYQPYGGRRVPIGGRFVLLKDTQGPTTVAFALDGDVRADLPVVIDPVLDYATYLGGSDVDEAFSVAVDGEGSAYLTGQTKSANFPTRDALQPDLGAPLHYDAFVSKVDRDGGALIFSTYLGGTADDAGNEIVLGPDGSLYIAGQTASADFPVTPDAFQTRQAGLFDAFVARLDRSGAGLIYSTYLGGSLSDLGLGLAVDADGHAYVAGSTGSADFPTQNPFQPDLAGGTDAFVSKLAPDGSALVYSTYLGGTGNDEALSVALDAERSAYVTGDTASADYPTKNPFQPELAGGLDALVTKLDPSGTDLVYSTYLGGSEEDDGLGIAVDAAGFAHVAGRTASADFPTADPLQPDNAGAIDAFVAELSQSGAMLVFSTYLGGSGVDIAVGIALDGRGNLWVSGNTQSADFPTHDPIQPEYAGNMDGFVAELAAGGTTLLFSTYLGGADLDNAVRIVADGAGGVLSAGATASVDFPVTPGVLQPDLAGSLDAFVARIAARPAVPSALTSGLFVVGGAQLQPPGVHALVLNVLVSSFADIGRSVTLVVNALTGTGAKVPALTASIEVAAAGAARVTLDLGALAGSALEVVVNSANPPSDLGLTPSAAVIQTRATDGATLPLVFAAPGDFVSAGDGSPAPEASPTPTLTFTSGLFQAPAAPADTHPEVHVLLSSASVQAHAADVTVRALLAGRTQKATVFTQTLTVPAHGGSDLVLDAHNLGVEGLWVEVDVTLPAGGAIAPSVQVMNGSGQLAAETLLRIGPRGFRPAAAGGGRTRVPSPPQPAPATASRARGLRRHAQASGSVAPGSAGTGSHGGPHRGRSSG